MMRKGYVEEQIEALVRTMARLLGLRENGLPSAETPAAIRNAAKELTGLDLDRIATMPDAALSVLLSTADGKIDAPKTIAAGAMLAEMADYLSGQGMDTNPDVIAMRRRALRLMSMALTQEPLLRTKDLLARYETLKRAVAATASGDGT